MLSRHPGERFGFIQYKTWNATFGWYVSYETRENSFSFSYDALFKMSGIFNIRCETEILLKKKFDVSWNIITASISTEFLISQFWLHYCPVLLCLYLQLYMNILMYLFHLNFTQTKRGHPNLSLFNAVVIWFHFLASTESSKPEESINSL